MNYYNVSLHGYFYFFMNLFSLFFFSKWSLSILLCNFFLTHHGLLQCFPTWFLFCYNVFPHIFFQNYLRRFFFNIELVENSALTFPACFFSICFHFSFAFFLPKLSSSSSFFIFCVFFPKLFLLIFFL